MNYMDFCVYTFAQRQYEKTRLGAGCAEEAKSDDDSWLGRNSLGSLVSVPHAEVLVAQIVSCVQCQPRSAAVTAIGDVET